MYNGSLVMCCIMKEEEIAMNEKHLLRILLYVYVFIKVQI